MGSAWPSADRMQPPDGVTYLTGYLILLAALPAEFVVEPLGAAGAPAALVAAGGMIWWLLTKLSGRGTVSFLRGPSHPTRIAMIAFVCAVLISYVIASTRAATTTEINSADVGLIMLCGWFGIVALAGDGVPTERRLETLVGRLCVAVGLIAALGIVQFVTGHTIVDAINIPGLTTNNELPNVQERGGFNRVIGTATHPIEFGVVLAASLPLCLHRAMTATSHRVWKWLPVAAISIAAPLSISRSTIVALAVALLVLAPTWTRRARWTGLLVIVTVLGAIFVAVPGMLGTLTSLFSGVSQDSSALSRTDSYQLAFQFIDRSPWIGRGFLTFLPSYRTLDNQYLGLLIGTGVLGTISLLGVFVTGFVVAAKCRRRANDSAARSLSASLMASIACTTVTFAFFDGLSFAMISGLMFLTLGCSDALWQLQQSGAVAVRNHSITAGSAGQGSQRLEGGRPVRGAPIGPADPPKRGHSL